MTESGQSDVSVDLHSVFNRPERVKERIGLEIESATLVSDTGRSAPYTGTSGIRALLDSVVRECGAEPVFEGDCLLGAKLDGGASASLELGGAFEYSSAPEENVTKVVERTWQALPVFAELAQRLGLSLVPGGYLPFNTADDVTWVPKPRASMMRDYYRALGDPGSRAPSVMTLNISTQVTIDYLSQQDLREKLRMLVAVSPIAAAIFANSPIEAGRFSGMLSRRVYNWFKADPARCGVLAIALKDDFTIENFVDWALDFPLIFYSKDKGHCRAPERPFRSLLRDGFDDESRPLVADWRSLLNQIWTDVRLRDAIELRVTDGPPYWAIAALPAFWSGLAYHGPSCQAAWSLLADRTVQDHEQAMRDIAVRALNARHGGESVRELASELVRLARIGIEARIAQGLEQPVAATYLDPVEEIVADGHTFAERLLQRWDGELACRPENYVKAYAI